VAHVRQMSNVEKNLVEKLKVAKRSENSGVRWENITMALKRNRIRRCGRDSSGSGWGRVAGCWQHGN